MSSFKKITVIIPCRDEEKGLPYVIADIPYQKLRQLGFTVDVLVVDNNSKDNTAKVAKKMGAKVVFEKKQGKGNALRTAFYHIPKNTAYVVMLDGDNTYKPYEIPRLIEPLENNFCDVVIGSRLGGKMLTNSLKFQNRVANWMFTFLVRQFYKANITDVLSGYYAWRKEAVDIIKEHVKSDGFSIEMELITKMVKLGFSLYSVPITYDERRGATKISSITDGVSILQMMIVNKFWKPKDKKQSKQHSR